MSRNTHGPDEADRFTRDLILAVEQDVDASLQTMTPEECMTFTRGFLQTMEQWQPEAIDLTNAPLQGAAQGLYLSMMFRHCFKKAYSYSNRLLIAKESLKSAFEND